MGTGATKNARIEFIEKRTRFGKASSRKETTGGLTSVRQ